MNHFPPRKQRHSGLSFGSALGVIAVLAGMVLALVLMTGDAPSLPALAQVPWDSCAAGLTALLGLVPAVAL